MSTLLTGLLGAALAASQPAAISNLIVKTTGLAVKVPKAPVDPVEAEYEKLLKMDDEAREEIDRWILEEREFQAKTGGPPPITLASRVKQRLAKVGTAYEDFIFKHPKHVHIHIAYGSFLMESTDEDGAEREWQKALKMDPKNPAVWNNLANHYGHRGPVAKAFEYYAKAIELNPKEAVYFQNYATTVYLFRKDAMEFFHCNETQVFDRALDLYRSAIRLDPDDFILASDYAESFYGTKPPRWADGLKAWESALKVARDGVEQEGVYIHLARIQIALGNLDEARSQLERVTNNMYQNLKATLSKKLGNPPNQASAPGTPPAVDPAPK